MHGMGCLAPDGMSDLALEIAAAGFVALWNGRADRPEALLPGRSERAARAVAELVERGRAEVDGDGRVVGVHGLTLRRTRHSFVHAGRTHSTWCAFDAIGIPAGLGLDAEARTTCPSCDHGLRIPIRRGRPEPSGAALWFPSAKVRHLIADFCAAADVYCSRGHLERCIHPARTPGEILDLPDAAALGRTAWADVDPASLRPPAPPT